MLLDAKNLSQLQYGSISTCIGIVVDFTTPKNTKTKEFYQAISLVDPSTNGKFIKLLIFNSDLKAFPNIKDKGDVLLCKGVKVQQFNDKVQLISNIASFFEVYPKIKKNNSGNEDSIIDIYRIWWNTNEYKYHKKNPESSNDRRKKISELHPDIKYVDIYCQLIKLFDYGNDNRITAIVTDYTENELLESREFHENPDIRAKIYFACTFWDENVNEIRKYSEGDYIFIKNIKLKLKNGIIEGNLHGNTNWVHIYLLDDNDSKIINENRENFIKNSLELPSTPPSPKDKRKNADQINNLINDSLIISEGIRNLIHSNEPSINDNNNITTSTPKKKIKTSKNLFISSPINNTNDKNKNIEFFSMPIRKLTSINHCHMPITKIKAILDSKQIPNRYRCRVKVVDFMPRKFESFTRPYCTVCKKTFDKTELLQCPRCQSTKDKIKYAFLFSLLVEDDSKAFLPIIIFEIEKSEFLGLPATSLDNSKDIENLRRRLSKLWTFKTQSYFINKEKTIRHTKTILCGNFFDVCIERYKNTQGIRQKIFDTKLII